MADRERNGPSIAASRSAKKIFDSKWWKYLERAIVILGITGAIGGLTLTLLLYENVYTETTNSLRTSLIFAGEDLLTKEIQEYENVKNLRIFSMLDQSYNWYTLFNEDDSSFWCGFAKLAGDIMLRELPHALGMYMAGPDRQVVKVHREHGGSTVTVERRRYINSTYQERQYSILDADSLRVCERTWVPWFKKSYDPWAKTWYGIGNDTANYETGAWQGPELSISLEYSGPVFNYLFRIDWPHHTELNGGSPFYTIQKLKFKFVQMKAKLDLAELMVLNEKGEVFVSSDDTLEVYDAQNEKFVSLFDTNLQARLKCPFPESSFAAFMSGPELSANVKCPWNGRSTYLRKHGRNILVVVLDSNDYLPLTTNLYQSFYVVAGFGIAATIFRLCMMVITAIASTHRTQLLSRSGLSLASLRGGSTVHPSSTRSLAYSKSVGALPLATGSSAAIVIKEQSQTELLGGSETPLS